jgi:hypothetical protein
MRRPVHLGLKVMRQPLRRWTEPCLKIAWAELKWLQAVQIRENSWRNIPIEPGGAVATEARNKSRRSEQHRKLQGTKKSGLSAISAG